MDARNIRHVYIYRCIRNEKNSKKKKYAIVVVKMNYIIIIVITRLHSYISLSIVRISRFRKNLNRIHTYIRNGMLKYSDSILSIMTVLYTRGTEII